MLPLGGEPVIHRKYNNKKRKGQDYTLRRPVRKSPDCRCHVRGRRRGEVHSPFAILQANISRNISSEVKSDGIGRCSE